MKRILFAGWVLFFFAELASAQHPTIGGGDAAPPPPPGSGTLTVQVVHRTDPSQIEGIEIALYALSPDGTPGLTGGVTNAQGSCSFEGISSDPAIIYLIGARYRDIPFGERTTFAPGQSVAQTVIEIANPSTRVDQIEIEELRARIDWQGDRLMVSETLSLINPSDDVVLIPEDDLESAITSRRLVPDASDFSPGPRSIGDALDFRDGRVRFRGPLYPGEQQIEYLYSLPISGLEQELTIGMRESIGRIVMVAGTPGIEITGPGLARSADVIEDQAAPLASWTGTSIGAGQSLDFALKVPESRRDPSLLKVPRANMWLEVDDTRLTANADFEIEVAPGAPVSGTPAEPLLHVSLPDGAELTGVSKETEALGFSISADGGFDLIGPIAAGTTNVAYGYRMPASPTGIDLGLRFSREVETLNILIADTGLALDSQRLHRRRPFRNGTRNYLHREAYNISPDETVDLSLVPLSGTDLPRAASVTLVILAAAGGAFFLFGPLLGGSRAELSEEVTSAPIDEVRESIYSTIRDLDHDFETGKIDEADYATMRSDLRGQAIDHLRRQRTPAPAPSASVASPASPALAAVGNDSTTNVAPHTGGFCPSCGGQVIASWRFCSHCGENLNPRVEGKGSAEEASG